MLTAGSRKPIPINDFRNLPIEPLEGRIRPAGIHRSRRFSPGRKVFGADLEGAGRAQLPLYLLDTNISKNSPEDRKITGALYGGDRELRIQQEIVLGIGGMRALDALGIRPKCAI